LAQIGSTETVLVFFAPDNERVPAHRVMIHTVTTARKRR
jgi:hypothetical protein